MYGCESWTIKKVERWRIDAFEVWCWRRLLRVPWNARRSNQSILKEISPNVHWKDWCCSWNSNNLATWYEELTHWKRPWCWERLKAGGEGDDREGDGWMVSPTQWTWVWVNSGSWWWTGRPGVLQSMGLQRVGHDWVTELNWTELFLVFLANIWSQHYKTMILEHLVTYLSELMISSEWKWISEPLLQAFPAVRESAGVINHAKEHCDRMWIKKDTYANSYSVVFLLSNVRGRMGQVWCVTTPQTERAIFFLPSTPLLFWNADFTYVPFLRQENSGSNVESLVASVSKNLRPFVSALSSGFASPQAAVHSWESMEVICWEGIPWLGSDHDSAIFRVSAGVLPSSTWSRLHVLLLK